MKTINEEKLSKMECDQCDIIAAYHNKLYEFLTKIDKQNRAVLNSDEIKRIKHYVDKMIEAEYRWQALTDLYEEPIETVNCEGQEVIDE
jgi:hypothetical protein